MRRAQTVRHYGRPSLALGVDNTGALRESPEESVEDLLRKQLVEKDRENDKLRTQIQSLQAQLAQRPPLEAVQALEKEYTNLDILLQGTQRENERCMAELERGKVREKMLERELEKLAGANWQSNLQIPAVPPTIALSRKNPVSSAQDTTRVTSEEGGNVETTLAHIEQIRMLILGMEQRLQTREDKLSKTIERAEQEGARFEEKRRQVLSTAC